MVMRALFCPAGQRALPQATAAPPADPNPVLRGARRIKTAIVS
jgi:hypothetical protein